MRRSTRVSIGSLPSALLSTLILLAIACDREQSGADVPEVSTRSETGLASWTLSTEPDLMLSGALFEGDSVFMYGILSATFIGDGGFAVALIGGGSNRLVYFDQFGRILAVAGGQGEGPGEFSMLAGLFEAEGRLAAWDLRTRRLSWFSDHGSLLADIPIRSVSGLVVGVFADGYIVSTPSPFAVPEGDPRPYYLWDANAQAAGQYSGPGEPADGNVRLEFARDSGRPLTSNIRSLASVCFAQVLHAVVGDAIVIADSKGGTVLSIGRSDSARVVVEVEERPVVSTHILQAARDTLDAIVRRTVGTTTIQDPAGRPYQLTVRGPPSSAVEGVLERIGQVGKPLPSTWSEMVPDRRGRVWLREAACLTDDPSGIGRWHVVDLAGGLVAVAAIPQDVRPLAADGDRLLARVTDSLGVEHIAIFNVRR